MGDRSNQVEEARKEACFGSQDQGHIGLAVGQTRDRIAAGVGSSRRTVVVEGSPEAGMEIGRDEMEGLAVKEAGQVEMNSGDTRVSALAIARYGEENILAGIIRRKATENIHMQFAHSEQVCD